MASEKDRGRDQEEVHGASERNGHARTEQRTGMAVEEARASGQHAGALDVRSHDAADIRRETEVSMCIEVTDVGAVPS